MSEELKQKLSLAKKGKTFSAEHRANLSKSHLGKIPTNLYQLISCRKGKSLTEEHKAKIKLGNLGKKRSQETRNNISLAGKGRTPWNKGKEHLKGDRNPRWLKDRTQLKKYNRQIGVAHSEWVSKCKQRDGKKCKLAGKECKGQLEVHHILRFSEYPVLRYEISNGITLCHYHHPRKKVDEKRLEQLFKSLIS